MSSTAARTVELTPHRDTPPGRAVHRVTARLLRTPEGMLAITYLIEGELSAVRVPEPRPRCVTDKLWQHTCCEVFIARKNDPRYHEFNFAPSGEWAVYAFDRYRERATLNNVTGMDPQIATRRSTAKLELDALMHLDRLSPAHVGSPLTVAVSTVIEQVDGSLSYWALKHPPGKPDFHHSDAFALELDEVRD